MTESKPIEVSENMTVSELFEAWIAEKKKTVSANTVHMYRSYYDKYLDGSFGKRKVNEILPEEWSEFENRLSTEKASGKCKYGFTSLLHAFQMYHNVFNYGKTAFGLNDPTGTISLVAEDKDSLQVFSHNEIRKIILTVKPFDIYHIGTMLCLYTGITLGEVCGAKWQDVDTDNKMLRVRRKLVKENEVKDGQNTAVLKTNELKGKAVRDIPIPVWLNDQLKEIKNTHSDDEFILVGPLGGNDISNFRYHYKDLLKQAGVGYRKPNALRHTFAMTCIEKGIDLKTLSDLLGHSNLLITIKMYLNTDIENSRQKLETLYD